VGREPPFHFSNGCLTALVPCFYTIEVPVNYRTRWIKTATVAISITVAAWVFVGRACGQGHSIPPDALRKGFANPPASARLRCYWWWLNGHTNSATITRDLEEMQKKGYGSVLLVDANGANQNGNDNVPAGPEFGSPVWTALYVHALKEADRLGWRLRSISPAGGILAARGCSRTGIEAADVVPKYGSRRRRRPYYPLASPREERLLPSDRCLGLSPASWNKPARERTAIRGSRFPNSP
jgi:hypothetical protein